VHDVQRIALLAHVQPGQRPPGSADGIEGAALQGDELRHVGQRLADDLLGLLDRAAGGILQARPPSRRLAPSLISAPAISTAQAAASTADDAVGGMKPDSTP
jgi:hypothetical protein